MKLNSNTILLDSNDVQKLIGIAENIAKENNVYNVKDVEFALDPTRGNVSFSTQLPPKEITSMYNKERTKEDKLQELANIVR